MEYLSHLNGYTNNKYARWYNELIQNAKNRDKPLGYTEKHHIVPKCLGGGNRKSNIAFLTGREHFIAHAFLARCFTGKLKAKMIFALHFLRTV